MPNRGQGADLDSSGCDWAHRESSQLQRGANFTLQNSDFLLAIGARLDYGQTGYSHRNFARLAKKVIVDVDPAEIAKLSTVVDVPAAFDARLFLECLLREGGRLASRDRRFWMGRVQEWKRNYPVVVPEYWAQADYVNNYAFIEALSDEMSEGDLLVPGSSGACSEITMQAFRVKQGMRIFNSEGLGPMGFGISAAIGACVASGGTRTVSIEGDGGFQMNSQELETIFRLQLPIKLFVLNNNGYGSIRSTQRSYFNGRLVASDPSSGLTLPEASRVAGAYGIPAARISKNTELRQTIRDVLQSGGPVVCELMISPDQFTAPRVTSMQRTDGTMVSKPLEDMWPFLSPEELAANLLVPALETP